MPSDPNIAGRPLALPPLNALCAFEATARHLSFTRAAKELGVTQTAVSHQIKSLEGTLGVVLFHRLPRHLTLTRAGQGWISELTPVFARLRSTNERLRRLPSERPVVSITTLPSFGARWLVPRLGGFLTAHPDLDVRISATQALTDFAVEPIDVGIRCGTGHYPGLYREKLADDAWLAVAAPSFLAKVRLRAPPDLAGQTLLYDDHLDAWTRWFAAQSLSCPTRCRYTQLTDSGMLVEAALRGQGIALARWSLAGDDLKSGKLVRVFPKVAPLPAGFAYYLVGPRENFKRREVLAFRTWIRAEAQELRVMS
jgi:LysR family glycine cleavage system transcriptional activator